MSEALDKLSGRIDDVISRRCGADASVRVMGLSPLYGGACQDNFRVELEIEGGPEAGQRVMVLRSDASSSLPGSLGREHEYAVIRVAVAAGVQTPAVRWLTPDLLRPGSHAYFMDWAEGVAIGRKVVGSPALEEARRRLPGQLAECLARIHSVRPVNAPELCFPNVGSPIHIGPAQSVIDLFRGWQDGLKEPRPAAELVLGWLERNKPRDEEITLVHSDFRTGNFLVTPTGLSAVLDWEFAHWGNPIEDIAWIAVRDWRFGRLDKPIGGFADREAFYSAYEAASGRRIDPVAVHFWEVMGNIRWALGCAFQARRYLTGERRDLELVAIARRACEMELEAMRLIEAGPIGRG